MFCSLVCESLSAVWDKTVHGVNAKCYSACVSDSRLCFFPTELKLLSRAVVSGALCGLEALLLSWVISQSSFKFSCNSAFLIYVMEFFLFLCCMTWSKDSVHGFAWCQDTQPSYEQVISRFR